MIPGVFNVAGGKYIPRLLYSTRREKKSLERALNNGCKGSIYITTSTLLKNYQYCLHTNTTFTFLRKGSTKNFYF